ncbi:MAG TPA: 1,2-phenylacetyl-CoA epoxidase subunit PaaD [Methylomirabilota bacterium]|nr:1,2-phenylacetyl-CoA epoxidase subunit PaaD [Methylomirabilota bacterium]
MSEGATQVTIAAARAGGRRPAPTIAAVRAALTEVLDPELPVLSVIDLGIVHRVAIDHAGIAVAILPTFVGCPALDVIRDRIATRLEAFGLPVRVHTTFEVPWTSERISPAGLRALANVGIAPPAEPGAVRCPFCASDSVVMDSAFGPTQCRSLYYCRACRQPFEALKTG